MEVVIKPFDTDEGVFWRIVDLNGNIVDDYFESTADAEMYCFDNNLTFRW